jgi:uncharacterized protein YdaU (DUF1376 family)
MSDIRLELSSPVAVERFRDIAATTFEIHGQLTDDLRSFLERKADELGVHRLDVERVLHETRELPSVKAAEAVARQKAKVARTTAEQQRQLHRNLRVSEQERWRLAEVLERSEGEVRDLRERLSEAEAIQEHYNASALIVSQEGNGQYRTIGEALQAAEPGSFILVRPGTYYEGLVIDKNVAIVGDTLSGQVIVESWQSTCLYMQAEQALVMGLTLRCMAGANMLNYFGVDVPYGRLLLEDCDITSDSYSCVCIHGATASPILRRCRIHDGMQCGVFIYDNGQGLIAECDIFGNALSGVEIREGSNPIVRHCCIYDGMSCGFLVWSNGQGLIAECDIFGNASSGVEIEQGGNPTVCRCRINRNNGVAVHVTQNGRGTIEDCDLTDNAQGAWDIADGCEVQWRGNQE